MYYIVGLGNPGEEYELTRHNSGRLALMPFLKNNADLKKVSEMDFSKKLNALTAEGKIKKENFQVIFPETFMNKSGNAIKPLITSKKKAEAMIVVHDDLDLGIGNFKICFNRGSGGHKGVESIMRGIKTEAFIRIKIGVSPTTPSGKLRKPDHKKLLDFIVGKYSAKEMEIFKKVGKKVSEAVEMILTDGIGKAMNEFNQ